MHIHLNLSTALTKEVETIARQHRTQNIKAIIAMLINKGIEASQDSQNKAQDKRD